MQAAETDSQLGRFAASRAIAEASFKAHLASDGDCWEGYDWRSAQSVCRRLQRVQ